MILNALERILTYMLGGVVGAALGYLALSYRMPYLEQERTTFVVSASVFVGILIAAAIFEKKKASILEKDSALREETIALITHEMRTGLTSTGWAIKLIIKKYQHVITPEDFSMLDGVVKSIQTTVMHTINLLDVSLRDVRKLSVVLEWSTLGKVEEMVREIEEKYRYGADEKGVELISDIKLDRNREVEVDILRLRIIIQSLLENALQFTILDRKQIVLRITNDKVNMYFDVSDTGIGIPKVEQEKIFSEFYRASNARDKFSHGSGIGLYICNQYIKAHHGTISFTSEQNKGTSFRVSIPLKSKENIAEFLDKV
ncbi:MAG: HAMP domain-containing sensor histidine kinase [bacterium]|nr:HAMP domain-containing sensor histidine kinase [bacterium]